MTIFEGTGGAPYEMIISEDFVRSKVFRISGVKFSTKARENFESYFET